MICNSKQQSDPDSYSVDMHDHNVTNSGVDDFFWPSLHHNTTRFSISFLNKCSKYMQTFEDSNFAAQVCRLSINPFVNHLGGIYQACVIKGGFEKEGLHPEAPKSWYYYPYIFKNEAPPLPEFLIKLKTPNIKQSLFSKIKNNPTRVVKLLKSMSWASNRLSIDGLKISPITDQILLKGIIATQRTPLIIEHAQNENRDVYFKNSQKWFKNIDEEELDSLENNKIKDKIFTIIENEFISNEISFPIYLKAHLENYFDQLNKVLAIHFSRLLKQDLPKTLWTGTGGNIWDAIFRLAVITKGGYVTGHDHGGGTGHINMPVIGNIELWGCNKFITFNQKQADLYTKAASEWPLLENTVPQISFIKNNKRNNSVILNSVGRKKIKNIILLSTLYDRDRGRNWAFYPDIIYTDWQARLISYLKKEEYNVLFKPHPESPILPHSALFDSLGAKNIGGYFEDIKNQADLIIFDYTYTTVFLEALKTSIPILVIDFDGLNWHENALSLLQKRCGFVKGRFDDNNRVQIDWDDINLEIEQARLKSNNRDFLETFYL